MANNKSETVDLVYHGYVFDACGYGQAARAYIHALHDAGVNIAVVNLSKQGRQVQDSLVESLVTRCIDADFNLFHGIPTFWAHRALSLRNVIAMTVWETDTMPAEWRLALDHALEVWLPCQFNVSVFERALDKSIFKLPHAWVSNGDERLVPNLVATCGIRKSDFVFYSIFEWQDRKGPNEMIEAFLRAFPQPAPVVLALKINPGAARLAARTLLKARQNTASQARVELRPEMWSQEQIAAFHHRGNCYVSLHRGEGWNYPLFEAACLGKPIVATGFSGPTEYLDATVHNLVQYRPAPVRQRYEYYSAGMNWVEPEIEHAIDLLRGTFAERRQSEPFGRVAVRIRRNFSSEAIGESARQRLLHLLRRTNSEKWERLVSHEGQNLGTATIPISGVR